MRLSTPYSPGTPSQVTLADGSVRDVPARMTVDEFEAFPWPDSERWELIWETPILAAQPSLPHQRLELVLARFIEDMLEGRPELVVFPDPGVVLPNARSYVSPDLAVLDESESDTTRNSFRGVPLLVVEILSPGTAALDVGAKRDAYAEAGVPEYWTIDPLTRAITVFVEPGPEGYSQLASDADDFSTSPLLACAFRVVAKGRGYRVITRPN
jgi:Uma2 family endonuclease